MSKDLLALITLVPVLAITLVPLLILDQFPNLFLFLTTFSCLVLVLIHNPGLIPVSKLKVVSHHYLNISTFVSFFFVGFLFQLSPLLSLFFRVLGDYHSLPGETGWCLRRLIVLILSLVFPCLAPLSCDLAQRTRALAMIRALEPIRFAQVLLDFAFIVRSQFRGGRRTGPDFISPMSSLTKRRSGYLARLLLEYCINLSNFELDSSNMAHRGDRPRVTDLVHPQAVVILDLDEVASDGVIPDEVPPRRLESQYTTTADVDLMALVPILLVLLVLLRRGWWFLAYEFTAHSFMLALAIGPGTLILSRRVDTHPAELDPGDGCAVLINDDMTVIIHGSQRIVEAITEGRFYLSFAGPRPRRSAEHWIWFIITIDKQVEMFTLLGLGLFILGSMLAIDSDFAAICGKAALVVIFGRMIAKACRLRLRMPTNDPLPPLAGETLLQSAARVTVFFLVPLSVALALLVLAPPIAILLCGVSFFAQADYPHLFENLVLQSYYPIRTDQFLDALGHPPIRRLPFLTRASAATFSCLVLCRDIPRPVKNIDILGVLDTLIPNQRDIWRAWKERVADRIIHEECVNFAPTVPTFPDMRQERLKRLLDEAQIGYDTYLFLSTRQSRGAWPHPRS